MRLTKFIAIAVLSLSSLVASAGEIAYGTIKGVKVYDFASRKATHIYYSADARFFEESGCEGVAIITHSLHGDSTEKMLSVALSAYMAGKKVRAFSEAIGSCEVGLLSVSDVYL